MKLKDRHLPMLEFWSVTRGLDHSETADVALGVVHKRDTNEVLLIVRREQIGNSFYAFPGGKIETTDDNAIKAAAREVLEEVGVKCALRGAYVIAERLHPTTNTNIKYVYLPYKAGVGRCMEAQVRDVFWKSAPEVAKELKNRLHPKVRMTLESLSKETSV